MPRIHSFRETGERHGVLRFLAKVCHFVGTVMLVIAAVALLGSFLSLFGNVGGMRPGFFVAAGLLWSIGLFAGGIQSIAVGSFFLLAIQVEENTRATAQSLERLRAAAEPKPEPDHRSLFLS